MVFGTVDVEDWTAAVSEVFTTAVDVESSTGQYVV